MTTNIFNMFLIFFFKGKVEAEFIIMNEQQAIEAPAGLGRNEPDPLPEPK